MFRRMEGGSSFLWIGFVTLDEKPKESGEWMRQKSATISHISVAMYKIVSNTKIILRECAFPHGIREDRLWYDLSNDICFQVVLFSLEAKNFGAGHTGSRKIQKTYLENLFCQEQNWAVPSCMSGAGWICRFFKLRNNMLSVLWCPTLFSVGLSQTMFDLMTPTLSGEEILGGGIMGNSWFHSWTLAKRAWKKRSKVWG